MGVSRYLRDTETFYEIKLGYKPEQTSLKKLNNPQEWRKYCNSIGESPDKQGIYSPRSQTAAIPTFIENFPLSLFHEYFGHGLYCEKSQKGQKLVNLEKKLLQEEKQEFQGKNFSIEDLEKFRENNKTHQELKQFQKSNLGIYEGFALLTEYILSDKFNMKELFEKKYDNLSQENKKGVDNIIKFNNNYGDLASFYEFGLARKTTPERVRKLLDDIYGSSAVDNSKLILLSGSKKPYSDIDLFTSSNYLSSVKNNWLDVVSFKEKDFENKLNMFEVQLTHPLFNGEFVAGDKKYLENKKNELKNKPITEESIKYNLEKARKNKKVALEYPENSEIRELGFSYHDTFLANALALKQGKKIFSKNELLEFLNHTPYRRLSSSESSKKLKGGIE